MQVARTIAFALTAQLTFGAMSADAVAGDKPAPSLDVQVTTSDSNLTADTVRAAIVREVEATVRPSQLAETKGALIVRVDDRGGCSIAYVDPEGRTITRFVELSKDPQRALTTIGILAANLVQNEAEELVSRPAPQSEPAPEPQPTTTGSRAPVPPSPPTPARVVNHWAGLFFAWDFALLSGQDVCGRQPITIGSYSR